MKIIKKYAMALAALAIVATTVTLMSFETGKKTNSSTSLTSITLYFQGDTSDASSVENPENWIEQANAEPCNTGDRKACAMVVNLDDIIINESGKRQLNPAEITLISQNTGSDYIPTQDIGNSNSSHQISVLNRN